MGKFSSVLLATDLDGTLVLNGEISKENADAIRTFQNDGGLFTVATGRYPEHFMDNFLKDVIPNQCMLCLNGNLIYDVKSKKRLKTFTTDKKTANNILKCALDNFEGKIEFINVCDKNERYTYDGFVRNSTCKCVFVTDTEKSAIELRDFLRGKFSDIINVERSWPTGVEIYSNSGGKGNAIKYLKENINPSIKTVICAGDYENDVTMLKLADIGYAIRGGADEAVLAADILTDVTCGENAIAWIINELYKKADLYNDKDKCNAYA